MRKNQKKKFLSSSTVDEKDVRRFENLGEDWWNPDGKMGPLHDMNPVRLAYLRREICRHYNKDENTLKSLSGLSIADIGCGGGVVAEPLCRMGASVTGLDAGANNIKIAKAHAQKQSLDIRYVAGTVEELARKGEAFDVVTALEIIEHVADPDLFIKACCSTVKKNGLLILSTLNRTPKSYLFGILAAEYVLHLLPAGTHDWKKFQKPSELVRRLEHNGLRAIDICGLGYNPLTKTFSLNKADTGVNYFLTATRG